MSGTIAEERWQPVLLVLNKRLECSCGSLATIIVGTIPDNPEKYFLVEMATWCQDCFVSQAEEEEPS